MRTNSPLVSLVSSFAVAAVALAPITVSAAPEEGAEEAAPEEAAEEAAPEEGADEAAPEGEEAAAEGAGEEAAAEGEGEEAAAEGEGEEAAAEGEGEEAAAEGEGEGEEAAAEGEGEEAAPAEDAAPSYLDEEDDRPPEPRIANKPARGKGLMIAGGVVTGVGAGLTIAFTLMTRNCSIDGPLQCGLEDQDDFLIPVGAATLLTGTMVLAVGVGYHLRYKKWEQWSPEDEKKAALVPVPTAMRGGGGLVWSGRF